MTVWERVSVVKPHCDLTRSKSAWFFAHFKNSFFSPFQQNRIAKTSIFEIVIVRAGANFTNVTERAFECASVRVFVDTDIECVCDLQAIELITIVCFWFYAKTCLTNKILRRSASIFYQFRFVLSLLPWHRHCVMLVYLQLPRSIIVECVSTLARAHTV